MTRMTAMTIRIWIQPPVFGNRGLMFPPKKPSSHRTNRITMMVHNMRFLLMKIQRIIRPRSRVWGDLTAQQYENASSDGKDRQDHSQATNAQKRYQAPANEKDGQQDHADVSSKMHSDSPLLEWQICLRSRDPFYPRVGISRPFRPIRLPFFQRQERQRRGPSVRRAYPGQAASIRRPSP
jgi:hypothetical protein